MSDDIIQIDTEALRSAAGQIETTAGAVDLSRDAATSLNLGGGAFGLMCAFLVPTAQTVSNAAVATMTQTAAMLRREAEALREVATDFDEHEENVSATLRGISDSVDGVR
jgi:hypothetical protein